MKKKLAGWKGRLLSHGGRLILIKRVLQILPTHIFAAFTPPKSIINRLERIMANFFWGKGEGGLKYHWVKWDDCCRPTKEGGIGLRKFEDICSAFAVKSWWNLRTSDSLWSSFMRQKYCSKLHPSECIQSATVSTSW